MFCSNCGNKLKYGVKFCTKCGKPVKIQAAQRQQDSAAQANQWDMDKSGREPAREYRAEPEEEFLVTDVEKYMDSPAKPSSQRQEMQYKMQDLEEDEAFEEEQDAEEDFYNPDRRGRRPQKKTPVGVIIAGGLAAVVILGGTAFFVGSMLGNKTADKQETSKEETIEETETAEETIPESTEAAEADNFEWPYFGFGGSKPAETTAVETTEAAAPVIHAVLGSIDDLAGLSQYPVSAGDTYQTSYAAPSADGKNEYYAAKAFDGLPETSWQDGVDGDGIGEAIGVTFEAGCNVKAITLQLGNHRSQDWYIRNNRPKTLTFELGGYSFDVNFSDEMKQQVVVFSSPIFTSDLTIRVDSVYPGSQYQDTAIAEVGVFYADY